MTPPRPLNASDRGFAREIDWNLIKLFHEIAEFGGITAAARALNRQQPTVSAGLKRFEAQLGAELCIRTSQGVTLTPAGKAVAELCGQVYDAVQALPRETAKASGAIEGTICLRMISDFVSPSLDAAMLDFHRRYPGVEIKLEIAPWRTVVKSVSAGEVELGIACDSAPNAELQYEPIALETQQLYCGKTHRCFGLPPVRPEQLADETYVLTGDDEPEELERFRRRFNLGKRVGGFAETLHEVRRLVQLGIGIGFLPTAVAAPSVAGKHLWPLLPEAVLPRYPVFLVSRPAEAARSPVNLLLDSIVVQARNQRTSPSRSTP